jgi:hypothetical protein
VIDQAFLPRPSYFDPLHSLSQAACRRWEDPTEQEVMVQNAITRARRLERV